MIRLAVRQTTTRTPRFVWRRTAVATLAARPLVNMIVSAEDSMERGWDLGIEEDDDGT